MDAAILVVVVTGEIVLCYIHRQFEIFFIHSSLFCCWRGILFRHWRNKTYSTRWRPKRRWRYIYNTM